MRNLIKLVIPCFVHLYKEIIHELQQVDYHVYRQTDHGITIFNQPSAVYALLSMKCCVHKFAISGKSGINTDILILTCTLFDVLMPTWAWLFKTNDIVS